MSTNPKISILIPTYLRLDALEKKIDELIKLSIVYNIEPVFVLEIEDTESYYTIKNSELRNYKICYNFSNFSHHCFPTALKHSSGEYIIHMGDDDYFEEGALDHIYQAIRQNPNIDWLIGKGSYIDNENRKIRSILTKIKYSLLKKFSFNLLSIANFVMTPSVIIKKNFLENIGGFDTKYNHANDYYCWLKAAKKSKPTIIEKNLSNVSFSAGTVSGSFDIYRYFIFIKKILFEQENKFINIFQILSTIYLVLHNILFKKLLNVFESKFNFKALINHNHNYKEKIKILHLTRFFDLKNLGGIEEGIIQLNNNAKKFDIQNDILCTSKKNSHFKFENMNVIQCKEVFSLSNNVFSYQFLKVFKKISGYYDIIHIHYPYPFADFTILNNIKNLNSKIILTYHSDIVKQKVLKKIYLYFFKKFFSKHIWLINVSSELYLEKSELKNTFAPNHKFYIQTLGLKDVSSYNWDVFDNPKLKNFFKSNKKVSYFIARDRHYKGFDKLYNLLEKNKDKSFVICSKNKKIKQYAKNKNNILYMESSNIFEKNYIIKNSIINIFTSDNNAESFGIILLESQMFGIPSIVYNLNTGVNTIIKNGYNGYSVSLDDEKEYNIKFQQLYNDDDLRENFSKNSKLNFKKNFSLQNFDNYYNYVIKELIKH